MQPLYLKGTLTPNIPRYIRSIACRLKELQIGPYTYRLNGTNRQRPGYGLAADIEKLAHWAELHYAACTTLKLNEERNNYYAIIELTDPVCQALERAGLIYTTLDIIKANTAHPDPSRQSAAEKAATRKRDLYTGGHKR